MDAELRTQVLRASIRDRQFLRECHKDLEPQHFLQVEEQLVYEAAIEFFRAYKEPVGSLVRSQVEDLIDKRKLGSESKTKARNLVEKLTGTKMDLVPVKALVDSVRAIKEDTFYQRALDELLTANEKGEFTSELLADLVKRANHELNLNGGIRSMYWDELEERISRRRKYRTEDIPMFMIGPLDQKIIGLAPGQIGLWMAPSNGGKGLALVHMSTSYALQGLNVLHISLEDPIQVVEDRMDASICGMPLYKLNSSSDKVREKFNATRAETKGRIQVVEHLEKGLTVSDIERIYEYEKLRGFEAQAVSIDYDEFLIPAKRHKGDNSRRFEIEDIYTELKQFAARTSTIVWTASQTQRGTEHTKLIEASHVAEGMAKIRRVFIAIGLGRDKQDEDLRCLNIVKHRTDRSGIYIDIISDYKCALLYDELKTLRYHKLRARKK